MTNHWLSDLQYQCSKRGISCFTVHKDNWVLGDQLTLGMRNTAGEERYVAYTPDCDIDLTVAEIHRYMDELAPGKECDECRL